MKTLKGVLERLNGKCVVPQLMTAVVPLSKALNNYKLQVCCNIDEFTFWRTGCVQKQRELTSQLDSSMTALSCNDSAFVHEGTLQNWFWTDFWGSVMV